ncbi:MAG: hypothetical protein JSV43_00420 [Methanobacteriota archaeon]|nr:MAG: hypothetical protein JSV43_00420 [Euryarchaeota archaeon]
MNTGFGDSEKVRRAGIAFYASVLKEMQSLKRIEETRRKTGRQERGGNRISKQALRYRSPGSNCLNRGQLLIRSAEVGRHEEIPISSKEEGK